MGWNNRGSRRAAAPCVIELLEDRRLLSAATVLASLRPLAESPAHVPHEQSFQLSQHVEAGPGKKAPSKPAKEQQSAKKNQKKASPVAPIIAPAPAPVGPFVQLSPAEQKALAASKPAINLIGAWSGTFTRNRDGGITTGGVTFTSQKKETATGTFDVASIAGQSVLSSVTVGKNRVFAAVLFTNNKGQVSLAGTVTSDHKTIYGRWSVETPSGWSTGIFQFTRQV